MPDTTCLRCFALPPLAYPAAGSELRDGTPATGFCSLSCLELHHKAELRPESSTSCNARARGVSPWLPALVDVPDAGGCDGCPRPLPVGTVAWADWTDDAHVRLSEGWDGLCGLFCWGCWLDDVRPSAVDLLARVARRAESRVEPA